MTQERSRAARQQRSRDQMPRKPSSVDIAREAAVSQSTVSRVLNNSPTISPATARRVLEAAERLGYAPNAAARTLITGKSNLIGLVLSNITNAFYPQVIEAVVATAAEHDYNVVLCNTQEDRELQSSYLQLLIEHQVDGAILTSSLLDSQPLFDKIPMDRIPLVLVNRTVPNLAADSVRLDNQGAGRIVAEHLAKLGHRRIAFVGGLEPTSTNSNRLQGFRDTLTSLGLELPDDHVVHGQFTRESGYALARRLIGLTPRPTAFFCANDEVALGAMDAIIDAGLTIPGDIAVVGVDDAPASSLRQVSLTTVRQPATEMGRRAMELLLERIRNGPGGDHIEIVLRPRLIVRKTCGGEATEATAPAAR